MVKPISIAFTSIVVDLSDSDSIIDFILGITSNISTIEYFKCYYLKKSIPQNESEVFDKLIIPFLITTSTNIKDDKVRTFKRVMFGWSEEVTSEHRHFEGILCNKNGTFYPRQNRIHYGSLHSNLFVDNILPIFDDNSNMIDNIFKHDFPSEGNLISILQKHICLLQFPHNLKFRRALTKDNAFFNIIIPTLELYVNV